MDFTIVNSIVYILANATLNDTLLHTQLAHAATAVPLLDQNHGPNSVNASRYHIETSQQATWFEADRFCRKLGMDLASVNSTDEYDQLVAEIGKTVLKYESLWLSGYNLETVDTFTWSSNGLPITSNYWDSKHPAMGNRFCVFMYYDFWRSDSCDRKLHFVCERKTGEEKISE